MVIKEITATHCYQYIFSVSQWLNADFRIKSVNTLHLENGIKRYDIPDLG